MGLASPDYRAKNELKNYNLPKVSCEKLHKWTAKKDNEVFKSSHPEIKKYTTPMAIWWDKCISTLPKIF